jgi:hypothetical protein
MKGSGQVLLCRVVSSLAVSGLVQSSAVLGDVSLRCALLGWVRPSPVKCCVLMGSVRPSYVVSGLVSLSPVTFFERNLSWNRKSASKW